MGLFGFVSREIEQFVNNATGKDAPADETSHLSDSDEDEQDDSLHDASSPPTLYPPVPTTTTTTERKPALKSRPPHKPIMPGSLFDREPSAEPSATACADERHVRIVDKQQELDVARRRSRLDQERIEELEEEVRVLREQLSMRASTSSLSLPLATAPTPPIPSSSSLTRLPPPPPPPPPAPPPTSFSSHTRAPSFLPSTSHSHSQPTPMPKPTKGKAPIAGPVAPDKMAAFLSEMKTVRLRKVSKEDLRSSTAGGSGVGASKSFTLGEGNAAILRKLGASFASHSPASASFPAVNGAGSGNAGGWRERERSRSGSTSEFGAATRVGEKRKRFESIGMASQPDTSDSRFAFKRRPTPQESSTTCAGVPTQSYLPARTSTSIEPSTSNLRRHSWSTQHHPPPPASITTPSLRSDDTEEETDRPPSTPPMTNAVASSSRVRLRTTSTDVDMLDIDPRPAAKLPPYTSSTSMPAPTRIPHPTATTQKTPPNRRHLAPEHQVGGGVFSKRPPQSPMPDPSPRRPRPPARSQPSHYSNVANSGSRREERLAAPPSPPSLPSSSSPEQGHGQGQRRVYETRGRTGKGRSVSYVDLTSSGSGSGSGEDDSDPDRDGDGDGGEYEEDQPEDEDEDPLAQTLDGPDLMEGGGFAASTPQPVRRRKGRGKSKSKSGSPGKAVNGTATAGTGKKGKSRRRVETTPASSTSSRRARSQTQTQRRRTLDQEIIESSFTSHSSSHSHLEYEEEDVDLDSGTLTGVGTRPKDQGFLARGGAGGPAVWMGEGYVEGLGGFGVSGSGSRGRGREGDGGEGTGRTLRTGSTSRRR